ncbi:MAG: GNAT family N-acetyltransferase [Mycobacteriales bacterium]
MSDDNVEVRRAEGLHRFEILLDGTAVGYTSFRESDGTRVFLHTEIDPAMEGHGLGGKLIRAALDQTRAEGLRVDPQCPFVRAFIEEHEDYADLVA